LWFPTISPDDPAPVVSGMIGVRLDPQGRLLRFEAVPPQIDDSSESGAEPRWSLLFERAGVDLATFTPARPTWSALGGTDLRRAWEGAWPDGPRTALRVEAAWRGRPTFFQLVTPWTKPRGVVSRPWGPGERLWSIVFGLVVLPLVLVGALILARRNLRRGRGDRRGAFRVALFAFVCGTAGWVFAGDHQPTFAELGLLFQSVAWNLMFAAIIWLVYLALEPYARRVWPEGLVSWSRLLQGGWRDPLVGRDILIGGLAHFVTYALFTGSYLLPVWMGLPLERPIPSTWLGFRQSIGNMFGSVQGTVVATIVTLFLLLLLRLPLRSTWAAAIALTLLYSLGSLFATANPWIVGPIQVFVLGLELFVLVRFGILAFLSAYCFSALLGSGPFSWDLSAWTTGVSLVQVSLVVAVAFYAFRVALAGRALFRESLFEEGSVGASGRGSGSR
jgi:serine/threonine-protein kinase